MRLALQTFIIIIYTLQQKAAGLTHGRGDAANSRIDINLEDIDIKEIWKKLQDFYKNTNMTVINTPNGNMTVINTLNGNMTVMNTPSNYSNCKFDIRHEKDQDYSLRQSQAPRGRSNTPAKSKIQKRYSHNY